MISRKRGLEALEKRLKPAMRNLKPQPTIPPSKKQATEISRGSLQANGLVTRKSSAVMLPRGTGFPEQKPLPGPTVEEPVYRSLDNLAKGSVAAVLGRSRLLNEPRLVVDALLRGLLTNNNVAHVDATLDSRVQGRRQILLDNPVLSKRQKERRRQGGRGNSRRSRRGRQRQRKMKELSSLFEEEVAAAKASAMGSAVPGASGDATQEIAEEGASDGIDIAAPTTETESTAASASADMKAAGSSLAAAGPAGARNAEEDVVEFAEGGGSVMRIPSILQCIGMVGANISKAREGQNGEETGGRGGVPHLQSSPSPLTSSRSRRRHPSFPRKADDDQLASSGNELQGGAKAAMRRGLRHLAPELQRASLYSGLQDAWKEYAAQLIEKCSLALLPSRMLSADLHGAHVTVVQSKDPSHIAISGIIVQDSTSAFHIATDSDLIRVVPKKSTVVTALLPQGSVLTLYGDGVISQQQRQQ